MASVKIREAAAGDAVAVAAILRAAFAEYERLYTPAGFAATTPGTDVILSRMPDGPIWVALDGDRIIGTVAAALQPDGCYIRSMAVLPESRARGLGRELLERVEQFALEHRAMRLYLSTTPFLDRAIRLYNHFGFQRSDEGPGDLFGTPLFTMTKDLASESSRRDFFKGALLAAGAISTSSGAPMAKLRYALVDVFTNVRWTGNPLAVILDASGFLPEQMQAIAREMNLSETTFVFRRAAAVEKEQGIAVRIFTTKEEVPFAGHPTLGTAWVLRTGASVTLDLKGGKIPVNFHETGSGLSGEMLQPEPKFGQQHPREAIARLAGVAVQDLVDDVPVQTVSTGRAKVIVPLRSLAAIRRVKPDFAGIEAYCRNTDGATGFYYITRETEDRQARIHARNILSWTEDPVTGSAGGACIAWMLKHGWARSGERIIIEQGSEVHRPGAMFGSAILKDGMPAEVRLGGQCVVAGQGELEI